MSAFVAGARVRVSNPESALVGREGTVKVPRKHSAYVRLDSDGRFNSLTLFGDEEIELIEAPAVDDDTPHAVRAGLMTGAQYEAFTTPGCHTCGTPFELDGPKAQQPDTVHCRECADAEAVARG